MTETKKYTVRPCKNQRTDLRDAFRVHFSTNTLSLLRLNAGDLCNIITSDNRSLPAKAWPAVDKVMDSIVMTTKTLQEAYNLHLGDQVTISRSENPASDAAAEEIVVEEIPDTDHGNPPAYRDKEDKTHWSSLLRYHACQAQELCPGVVFKSIRSIGEQRSFRVVRINDSHDLGLYSSKHTKIVRIQDNAQSAAVQTGILEITNELIGGLNSQIDQINKILRPYSNCGIEFKKNARHRTRRGGIILHGPHGTGKSMILGEIVKAGWNRVLHITRNTISLPKTSRTEAVQKIFTNANDHQPSVVIIDDLDKFAGKTNLLDDQHSLHIAPSLQEAFDQREDNRVLVVAATNRLANIVPDLRRRGRFEYEIEITVPNTQSRKEILKLLCGLPATSSHLQLEALAERTHGYVGDDLEGLLQVASDHTAVGNPEGSMWDLAEQDIESALNVVRPTTMKEAIRGLPKVKWSDIAGSDDLKKKFEHVVASFKHYEELKQRGREPMKSVLLYGPPGCSKTMTAQAMASEMELNFFAVSAAGFYSMYVGESERALRDIFDRARAARPSILFFDEIDAIGRSRGSDHGGLNVLQTMLTEIDGIIPLDGVFIMAATNRKDLLDSALLRRFDKKIFVGLPDFETRLAIIRMKTRTMPVDSLLNLTEFARATGGFSGADIAQTCKDADDRATRGNELIRQEHVDDALEELRRNTEMVEIKAADYAF